MAIITFEKLISAGRMGAIKRLSIVYFMYIFLRLLESDVISYDLLAFNEWMNERDIMKFDPRVRVFATGSLKLFTGQIESKNDGHSSCLTYLKVAKNAASYHSTTASRCLLPTFREKKYDCQVSVVMGATIGAWCGGHTFTLGRKSESDASTRIMMAYGID